MVHHKKVFFKHVTSMYMYFGLYEKANNKQNFQYSTVPVFTTLQYNYNKHRLLPKIKLVMIIINKFLQLLTTMLTFSNNPTYRCINIIKKAK